MSKEMIIDGVPGRWLTEEELAALEPEPQEPEFKPPQFDAATFFDAIRQTLFGGSLNQSQVDGINYLGAELTRAFPEGVVKRIEMAAYCLATFQWETASTMQPIEEYGGKSSRYAPWYGRGYVQLTWEENYKKQQEKLKTRGDIFKVHDDRERALIPEVSAAISIYGMIDGDFTGKKLRDYINAMKTDYVNARRIVNGTNKAQEIAEMAQKWESALRLGMGLA